MSRNMVMKCAMPQSCSYERSMNSLGYGFGGAPLAGKRGVTLQRNMNSHNNFLANGGHLSANIAELTKIVIPKGYSQIVVYLFSETSVIKKEYSLPHEQPQTINLSHGLLKDGNEKEGWTMSREIYSILDGEKKEISRGCTWTTVSKSNIIEFAKTKGINLPEWLSSWQNYSHNKKL